MSETKEVKNAFDAKAFTWVKDEDAYLNAFYYALALMTRHVNKPMTEKSMRENIDNYYKSDVNARTACIFSLGKIIDEASLADRIGGSLFHLAMAFIDKEKLEKMAAPDLAVILKKEFESRKGIKGGGTVSLASKEEEEDWSILDQADGPAEDFSTLDDLDDAVAGVRRYQGRMVVTEMPKIGTKVCIGPDWPSEWDMPSDAWEQGKAFAVVSGPANEDDVAEDDEYLTDHKKCVQVTFANGDVYAVRIGDNDQYDLTLYGSEKSKEEKPDLPDRGVEIPVTQDNAQVGLYVVPGPKMNPEEYKELKKAKVEYGKIVGVQGNSVTVDWKNFDRWVHPITEHCLSIFSGLPADD